MQILQRLQLAMLVPGKILDVIVRQSHAAGGVLQRFRVETHAAGLPDAEGQRRGQLLPEAVFVQNQLAGGGEGIHRKAFVDSAGSVPAALIGIGDVREVVVGVREANLHGIGITSLLVHQGSAAFVRHSGPFAIKLGQRQEIRHVIALSVLGACVHQDAVQAAVAFPVQSGEAVVLVLHRKRGRAAFRAGIVGLAVLAGAALGVKAQADLRLDGVHVNGNFFDLNIPRPILGHKADGVRAFRQARRSKFYAVRFLAAVIGFDGG